MATVTFSGTVSAQVAAGETVTITITKPDNTTETVTTPTKVDKTFSTTKDYTIAGAYSAIAGIASDPTWTAATSPSVPFTIALQTRTITLNTTVA
jgi:hypothetical protein